MRRDQFEQIREMMHFTDPLQEDPNDCLRKFPSFLDLLSESFTSVYIPEQNIAVDSSFVSTFFFFTLFSRTFTNHRTAGEGGGHFINSSLPLPPASKTLRHYPGGYCRDLTSTHSQQPDSNREPLVSERYNDIYVMREQCRLSCFFYHLL